MASNNRFIDNLYALKFVRLLTQAWKDTAAYKAGIIDHNGKVLIPFAKRTPQQKQLVDKFDVLVWNIKRLIEKVPLGKKTITKYMVALRMLKEHVGEPEYNKICEHIAPMIIKEDDGGGAMAGGDANNNVNNVTGGIDYPEVPFGSMKRRKLRNYPPSKKFKRKN